VMDISPGSRRVSADHPGNAASKKIPTPAGVVAGRDLRFCDPPGSDLLDISFPGVFGRVAASTPG
jgi:hypothetical protein